MLMNLGDERKTTYFQSLFENSFPLDHFPSLTVLLISSEQVLATHPAQACASKEEGRRFRVDS